MGDEKEFQSGEDYAASSPALADDWDDRPRKRPADYFGAGGASSLGRSRKGVHSSASRAMERREQPRPRKKIRRPPSPSGSDEWRVDRRGGAVGGGLERHSVESLSPLSWPRVVSSSKGGEGRSVQGAQTCVSGVQPSRKQTIYPHMDVVAKWNKLKTVLTKEELPAIVGLMMAEAPVEVKFSTPPRDYSVGMIHGLRSLSPRQRRVASRRVALPILSCARCPPPPLYPAMFSAVW